MSEAHAKPTAPSSGDTITSSLPVAVDPETRGRPVIGVVAAILTALRFYSRLAIPVLRFERSPHAPLDLARVPAAAAVAIAGALVALVGGAVLYMAAAAGLPPLLSALLALAALVLATGALHEDGLADTADGFGGGRTRERRLEIMRDSRIGSFGAIALILSLALRATALAVLLERLGAAGAALSLIAVAPVSRVAGLLPLRLLAPARVDGAAAAATAPTALSMTVASGAAVAIAAALLWTAGLPAAWIAVACAVALAMGWATSLLARAMLGGHTGDVAGAAQQAAEVGMLVALVAAAQRL
jgi:adenosylcobinamide-GDP ribazoletransferase